MRSRSLLYVLATVLTLGLVIGAARAIHTIASGELLGQGLTRVAGSILRASLNLATVQALLGVAVLWVVWLLWARRPGGRRAALRIDTILVLGLVGAIVVDAVLKRFTVFTMPLAFKQMGVRARELLSGTLSAAELGRLLTSNALVLVLLLSALVVLALIYRWLGRVDLERVYFRRWIPPRVLITTGVVGAAVLGAVNVSLAVDARRNAPSGPNVILICIDALRADHLGAYGNPNDVSPFMDGLAREGVMFRNVMSQSSWTKTSVATFMTSQFGMLGRVAREVDVLPPAAVTLAEMMQQARYRTGAFVANPWLQEEFGFSQGFDTYDDSAVETQRIDQETIYEFLRRHREDPFFLYLHYMDVHNPYDAPGDYHDMFVTEPGEYYYENAPSDLSETDLEYMRALYLGEIRYLDDKIKALFAVLDEEGLRENTVIVFTSDHGDEFQEHGGLGHGTTLHRELVEVPLFIAPNEDAFGASPVEVETPVRSVDILPTILDIAEVTPRDGIDGVSLTGLIDHGSEDARPSRFVGGVVSVYSKESYLTTVEGEFKYIYNVTRDVGQLYNVIDDPYERVNLVDSIPATAFDMRDKLLGDLETFFAGGDIRKTSIDKKTMEKLKALGYL